MVQDLASGLADAAEAKRLGADLVEFRIDEVFHGEGDEEGEKVVLKLVAESVLPCIVTCRPTWEGGGYDGSESARISLYEKLGTSGSPPRYIDVELAAYARSANVRQKVDLAVDPRGRDRHSSLILSMHDFEGRPADLTRRVAAAWGEAKASVVKVAFRARSLRDNLELFELLRESPKPMIALGMGEFGLMSRVLAPKFGGFLTFASLRKESVTAPGQPTVGELLGMYRFRKIGRQTRVYGVIGWPVGHSMSPLVHNAGFEAVGHNGVYLPLPVAAVEGDEEANEASFKATVSSLLLDERLNFEGASITMPFKGCAARMSWRGLNKGCDFVYDQLPGRRGFVEQTGAANTFGVDWNEDRLGVLRNSDAEAVLALFPMLDDGTYGKLVVVGTGGVARAAVAAALASSFDFIDVVGRSKERALALTNTIGIGSASEIERLRQTRADVYINCTPIGMAGGPDPKGMSIPVDEIRPAPETVFFDTVYNPIETPMLKAARRWGCRTIDGVEMFVRQAALQFELWTGKAAPVELFDRLVRERLS